MNQKGNQGTEQRNRPKRGQPKNDDQDRQGNMRGGQTGKQSSQQGSQRDQLDLDDEGRPVGVGEWIPRGEENDRKRQAAQWDEESEGTSRQSGPVC